MLTKKFEAHISNKLPEKFAIVIVGWSNNDTYYLEVFAPFPYTGMMTKSQFSFESVLLAFSPLLDETSLTAISHMETIEYIMTIYKKTWENFISIIGDNVSSNTACIFGRFDPNQLRQPSFETVCR